MSSAEQRPDATYFRPERTHVIATLLMTGIALIGISWAPLALGWVLIFPVLFLVWVFKAHTRIDDDGVSINYVFKKNVSLPWEEFDGIAFQGSRALARDHTGKEHSLPGVTFNSLPRLEEASRGRIPDVLTEGLASVDGKVSVIDKDGRQVLMSQEEYEAHEAEKNRDTATGRSAETTTDNSESSKE